MIRNNKGEFVAECSECGAETYGGTEDDFRAFVEQIKEEGWKVRKDGEDWLHICPDCQE